ncbi:tetratricopeptide repeat protein [Desulfonauticus submarinus]
MSLIYKNLQKISKDKVTSQYPKNSLQNTPLPGPRSILKHILLILLGTTLLLFAFLFWLSNQVNKHPLSLETAISKKYTHKIQKNHFPPQDSNSPKLKSIQKIKQKTKNLSIQNTKPIQKKTKIKGKKVKLVKSKSKKTSLKQHFLTQVKRNQELNMLNHSLIVAINKNDFQSFNNTLKHLSKIIGQDNFIITRWKGIAALKQHRFQKAENLFLQSLKQNNNDFTCRLNLIYALMGQNKIKAAQKEIENLLTLYPENEKVQKLAQRLLKK